ncbi:N-6 DNA Methylase [Rubripirellula tenax]|uniref:site-specific DNA-methyltransferase (adenine-specific) n=1 Tax=Rubripirellula tenax TaxID=2528015 RepID=A0A5C6F0P0_9BACT|nr:N-6 DNA Methylase [Rubripirellula tenax]
MLKKCKRTDDVLFINAEKHFKKGKRQNFLSDTHIDKIIDTYQHRRIEDRFSARIEMSKIADEEDYNLNISRYVSTAEPEVQIDLAETHRKLVAIEAEIEKAKSEHNSYLKELGLPPLP